MSLQRTTSRALAAATLALSTSAALADVNLLGDTLSFLRAYPNTATQYLASIPDTVVAAGTSDQVSWVINGGTLNVTTFNPEAYEIHLTANVITGYVGSASGFDGYVISGFDHDIQSFTLNHATEFGVSISVLDPRSMAINLSGYGVGTLTIGIALAQPVPEPASMAMMAAGLGLIGVAARRRQKAA